MCTRIHTCMSFRSHSGWHWMSHVVQWKRRRKEGRKRLKGRLGPRWPKKRVQETKMKQKSLYMRNPRSCLDTCDIIYIYHDHGIHDSRAYVNYYMLSQETTPPRLPSLQPPASTGWTPRLAKPKQKAKPFSDADPMPKSRQKIEARYFIIGIIAGGSTSTNIVVSSSIRRLIDITPSHGKERRHFERSAATPYTWHIDADPRGLQRYWATHLSNIVSCVCASKLLQEDGQLLFQVIHTQSSAEGHRDEPGPRWDTSGFDSGTAVRMQ